MQLKISDNFDIRELVHPDIFGICGMRSKAYINPFLPITLEAIKKHLTEQLSGDKEESVTVNNWIWGGDKIDSGLRMPNGTVGSKLSGHKFGAAADTKYKHHTPHEVFDFIIANQDLFPYINRMEDITATPTWNHIEVGSEKRVGNIYIFKP